MLVAKQVADLITITRALLGLAFVWLGITQGQDGLPLAVWLLILNWTGDTLDGAIARRSRVKYHTWVGDHDLEVDISVAGGLFLYMVAAGYVNIWLAGVYIIVWGWAFWSRGVPRSLGMLSQAPIYAWFIGISMQSVPEVGRWLVIWILAAIIFTWPRFPREVIPEFIDGMRNLTNRNSPSS